MSPQGRPLPLEDDPAASDWAMADRMSWNAGAPSWIEADKVVRAQLAELHAIVAPAPRMRIGLARARKDIARLVEETNRGDHAGRSWRRRHLVSTVDRST